jgi:hypothetical protein
MRLARLLLCVLVLAAVAAAQSTSPSTPDSGQNSAPPGQPPQSPVVDQPTLQQQEQKQESDQKKAAQTANFDLTGASGEQDQELGEIRMMTRFTQIGGSDQGQARSFHIPGSNNLAEANYFLDRRWFGSTYRFQFLGMFRSTDDSSIDPEHNSVQKGYIRIYNPRKEFIFGDALVNYSRLTFNQNIKGVSAATRLGDRWKLSSLGGVFIDRYGSLFKNQPAACFPAPSSGLTPVNDPQCGRPFTSVVSGARLEYAFTRDSAIGFNFATSDDLRFTRVEQPFNTSPAPASNRVGSIDLKYQKGMFRTESEFAYSATNFDTRYGTCVAPCDSRQPLPGWGTQGDWGGRLDASYRHGKWSFRGSYIRFQPNFAAMNARQISDAQDGMFRVSYDLLPWLTVDGTARRFNDDLKKQKTFQQTLWGPEGRLIFHDLAFYRKAVLEVGYRHRIIDGSNDVIPIDPLTNTRTLVSGCQATSSGGMLCTDRTVRTPYAELNLPVGTTFFTVGYERRQSIDRMKHSGNNNTDRIYGGIRGIYDFAGWHINPSLRYEFERDTHRLDPDSYYSLIPNQSDYLNPLYLLFLDHDNNRLATASLYMEAPRWFIVELQFRDSSATAANAGTLNVPCSPSSTPPCQLGQQTIKQSLAGPAGYSRPSYRANITYKIANDENKLIVFSFERNNNFYFSGPSDQNPAGYVPGGVLNPLNFDERLVGVTFVYKFGKRAR